MASGRRIISQITERHRSGKRSVRATIEAALSHISLYNQKLNALCVVASDAALARADLIDQQIKSGQNGGRLLGVPFTAKDTINVAGLPRSDGFAASLTAKESCTAELIRLLEADGAICIGKGNMAEQGRSYFTDNLLYGRSINPWDYDRTPGGSGGGDAAAVASGMAAFGIGADAGGSVRVPANFCGLFGLCPTPGSISTRGLTSMTHTWKSLLRSHGPMAHTLHDLRILTKVLFCFDSADPFSSKRSVALTPSGTRRIAILPRIRGVQPDPAITSALQTTADRFVKAGFLVDHVPLPFCEATLEPFIILAGQAALLIDDLIAQDSGAPRDLKSEGPAMQRLRERINANLPPLQVETFFRAWFGCHGLRAQASQFFTNYDFILAPVTATLAMPHGTSTYNINGVDYQSEQVFHFASMVNLLGLPSLAFPTGLTEGIPVGLQLIGNRFSEDQMFDALEEVDIVSGPSHPELPTWLK